MFKFLEWASGVSHIVKQLCNVVSVGIFLVKFGPIKSQALLM